jgi:hypothetical protein
LAHYAREVGLAECELGCGAFAGLGLRHIPQCILQLSLQSGAGGDDAQAEVVRFGRAFGQKSFNLGSAFRNVAVHALNVGGVNAVARFELEGGLQGSAPSD